MILDVFLSAAIIVAASVLIGRALGAILSRRNPAEPAVGLGAMIIVARVGVKLPGHTTTAAVLIVLLALAAAVIVVRLDRPQWRRAPVGGLIAAAIALFGACIPFLANGHVGVPGVSLDNDTASHLLWTAGLSDPITSTGIGIPPGYPLGPHSLVAAVGVLFGIRLDLALTGLLMAIVVVTALVGAGAMRAEAWWRQVPTGVLAALLYLVAAYYAEGAFKEPLLGVIVLAFALELQEFRDRSARSSRPGVATLLPVAVLTAASIYVFSYPAIVWIALTVALWLLGELILAPRSVLRWRQTGRAVTAVWLPVGLAGLAAVILLATDAGRVATFVRLIGSNPAGAINTSNIGNLAHELPFVEALGIWNTVDFRFDPANVLHAGILSGFALIVLLWGIAWSIGRRELVLPAAVAACAVVFWRSNQGQSIYVTAKALVIAGPVIAVTGMRGLLQTPIGPLPAWLNWSRLGAAVVFVALALHSSYYALRNEPVGASEPITELQSLDHLTRGQTVLFLGDSDYAPWLFHDSRLSALALDNITMSLELAAGRPNKPGTPGTALDFDSADPSTINRFTWVVTTSTDFASQQPAGFRLVRRLPMFELWRRTATVAPRRVLEASGSPGAFLNCRTKAGRALSRRRGVAAVMTPPVITGLGALRPGASETVLMRLPAGTWQLSLQYVSPVALDASAGGHRWTVTPYVDRPGPFFAVGSVTSSGQPVPFYLTASRPSSLTGPDLLAAPTAVVATRLPDTRTLLPLRQSCGRYVDWYRG